MTEIVEEQYTALTCCECAVKFWIPTALHKVALWRGEEFMIFCPNGHEQWFDRAKVVPSTPEPTDGEVVKFQVVK